MEMTPQILALRDAALKGDPHAITCLSRIACGMELKSAPLLNAGVEWKSARVEIKAMSSKRVSAYLYTYEPYETDRLDRFGDLVNKSAGPRALERIKARGGTIPMHDDHMSPVGVWDMLEDDPTGARSAGEIEGMYAEGDLDAPHVERILGERKSTGSAPLNLWASIAYITLSARMLDGKGGRPRVMTHYGHPARELLDFDVIEGSLTRDPINRYAAVLEVKSARFAKWQHEAVEADLIVPPAPTEDPTQRLASAMKTRLSINTLARRIVRRIQEQ